MKKKFLSILICGAVVLSQGAFLPIVANASEVNGTSIGSIVNSQSNIIVVNSEFSGNDGQTVDGIKTYKTLKSAIDSVDKDNANEVKIFIKNGVYKEKVTIDKPNITLIGEDNKKTVITYDFASGTPRLPEGNIANAARPCGTYGTDHCGTLMVTSDAKGFSAANLTVENSFDENAHSEMKNKQAVAMRDDADDSMFVNCRFLGNQDTLYAYSNKQYYYKCYIEGDVDFIFGAATAVFEGCEIKSVDRNLTPKGYIAAPSTLANNKYGFLFENCKLTSDIKEAGTVHLGRPWHPTYEKRPVNSSVVYKNCEMGKHISTQGWDQMRGVSPLDNNMFEYGSIGEGAIKSDTRRVLSEEDASKYTKEAYLQGWDISDKVSELTSYVDKLTK